jgi:Xaa-Pro aminopeptidase
MQTMHSTLLVGPSDWEPQRISRQDYDDRLAALWRDHADAGGAIVYGDSRDHAALAYLTHFTPKLEAGIALIPRRGEPRMLIGGGINMLPAAKPLTFISALGPLRDAAKTIADWAGGLETGSGLVLLGGDAMPYELRSALNRALGNGTRIDNGDAAEQARMLQKSTGELQLLRSAGAILDAAVAALHNASRAEKSVTDCILAAEHTALQRGAQDVRSLFSPDGGRTLRPFDIPLPQRCDPLQTYLAIRYDGYWAEAFVRVGTQDDPLDRKAKEILKAMIAETRPGTLCRKLHELADLRRGTLSLHPLADETFGSSVGLSLDEPPLFTRRANVTLEKNAVYSLRSGLLDEAGAGAVVSSMVLVTEHGPELLWPIGGLS